jgi:hypothetical protein
MTYLIQNILIYVHAIIIVHVMQSIYVKYMLFCYNIALEMRRTWMESKFNRLGYGIKFMSLQFPRTSNYRKCVNGRARAYFKATLVSHNSS